MLCAIKNRVGGDNLHELAQLGDGGGWVSRETLKRRWVLCGCGIVQYEVNRIVKSLINEASSRVNDIYNE